MHSQFSKTIKAALKSTNEERAVLRARSALQRFPVLEWRSRMENMHRRAIKASRKYAGLQASGITMAHDLSSSTQTDLEHGLPRLPPTPVSAPVSPMSPFRKLHPGGLRINQTRAALGSSASSDHLSPDSTRVDTAFFGKDEEFGYDPLRRPSMSRNASSRGSDNLYADAGLASPVQDTFQSPFESPAVSDAEQEDHFKRISIVPSVNRPRTAEEDDEQYGSFLSKANQQLNRKLTRKLTKTHGRQAIKDPFIAGGSSAAEALPPVTEEADAVLRPPIRPFGSNFDANRASTASFDSINSIMEEHGAESPLNQAIEGFTDENGQVTQEFIAKLEKLDSANSKGDLCIAEYLVAAEKAHFKHVRDDKLAFARSKHGSGFVSSKPHTPRRLSRAGSDSSFNAATEQIDVSPNGSDQALTRPAGLNWWQIRLQSVYCGWPLYAILLAIGQVLGATSFQLSLLGGTSSQRNFDLYSKFLTRLFKT